MKWVPEIVVNPFDCGFRVRVRCLSINELFGTIVGSNDPVLIDLGSGVVRTPIDGYVAYCHGHHPGETRSLTAMEKVQGVEPRINHALEEQGQVDPVGYSLIVQFARGRVSGPDIVKGLKRRGIEPNCEVRDNYLGGYDIEHDGKTINVERFIKLCSAAGRVDT